MVIGKSPDFYAGRAPETGRPCAKVAEPRVTAPAPPADLGSRPSACSTRRSPPWRGGKPYGIGAYFAYRHDPITGMPDPEAMKRGLDKLKLLVSIDVRYSETGWFSDVILPEATYLERANILGAGARPRCRSSSCATRRSPRASTAVRLVDLSAKSCGEWRSGTRSTSRRIRGALDWQLEGTGVTVAEMREKKGSSLWPARRSRSRARI